MLLLPEVQRKQLLEGSWDIAEGAAFSEFDRTVHVVPPFEIPNTWRKFRLATTVIPLLPAFFGSL